MFGKMFLMNRFSGINDPQASYGTVSTTNASSFLSLTEYTDAFLWLLRFLSAEDLLHIKLLSKQYYRAFHDPEIYFPLKEFLMLSNNTDLGELTTLFNLERNRRQKPDRLDKVFKCVSCENIPSDFRFPDDQFKAQYFILKSLDIAVCCTFFGSAGLSIFFFTTGKKEYEINSGITAISTVIAALCFTATCCAYTSCYRTLSYYRSQQSKLDAIRNNIDNVKITNTLFANKERAGFNNDSSESSLIEEGLLFNFNDEAESCEETPEYNITTGREKTP